MRNNDDKKSAVINRENSANLRQTNNDLKHLPIHFRAAGKTMSENEHEARVDESLEEDATPCDFAPIMRVSQDTDNNARLMKSALSKNLRLSTGSRIERLILRSSGGRRSSMKKEVRRSQPSIRPSFGQNEGFSDGNDLSPKSSQRWAQMLPAVNSDGSFAHAIFTNNSYGEIMNVPEKKRK